MNIKYISILRLDDEQGILVTGGVDANDRALASVEFFSIPKQVFKYPKTATNREFAWKRNYCSGEKSAT